VVTGVGFETAMRERLLAPLGMTETLFRCEDTTHRQVALPHKSSTNGQNPIPDFSFPRARTASGGVLASTRDLLRFAAAALGTPLPGSKSVISENARAAMLRPAVPAEGPGVYQSIGWQVRLTEAGPLVHHGGSYTGYSTRLILAPTRGFAVAVLTNSDSGYQLCREVQSLFERRILDWQEPEPTSIEPAAHILDRYPCRTPNSPSWAARWTKCRSPSCPAPPTRPSRRT
jgi:CubicO group peptidase (beta-lactamase class C family)